MSCGTVMLDFQRKFSKRHVTNKFGFQRELQATNCELLGNKLGFFKKKIFKGPAANKYGLLWNLTKRMCSHKNVDSFGIFLKALQVENIRGDLKFFFFKGPAVK